MQPQPVSKSEDAKEYIESKLRLALNGATNTSTWITTRRIF